MQRSLTPTSSMEQLESECGKLYYFDPTEEES